MELSMLVSLEPRTKEKTNKKSEKKTIKNKKTSNRSKKKIFTCTIILFIKILIIFFEHGCFIFDSRRLVNVFWDTVMVPDKNLRDKEFKIFLVSRRRLLHLNHAQIYLHLFDTIARKKFASDDENYKKGGIYSEKPNACFFWTYCSYNKNRSYGN